MNITVFIIVHIMCAVLCYCLAKTRGCKKAVLWSLMGGIIGPLFIPFALFVKAHGMQKLGDVTE